MSGREIQMTSYQAEDNQPARDTVARGRSGPTAIRLALGLGLRRLREARQITPAQAAEAIRATPSKISRLELGRTAARERDVADLLNLYGVTDEAERKELLALTHQVSAPSWWHQYSDVMPKWLDLYIGLEKAASVIRGYEVQFVHGLMQTEDYAKSVVLISNANASAEEIDRRVSLRMRRQRLLTDPGAPELWAVLDEAALRRPPCGEKVMRAQLERLLELTDLPNVTVQIVPFLAGSHAAAGGPFTILRFPEPDLPDVVYLEQLNSALYLDQPADVVDYLAVMDQLCVQADNRTASRDMLRTLLRDLLAGPLPYTTRLAEPLRAGHAGRRAVGTRRVGRGEANGRAGAGCERAVIRGVRHGHVRSGLRVAAVPEVVNRLAAGEGPAEPPAVQRGRTGVLDHNLRLEAALPAAHQRVGTGAGTRTGRRRTRRRRG
jgi:transcriptional regulator with XRE-family HTH domain